MRNDEAGDGFAVRSYLLMLGLGLMILAGLVVVERVERLRFDHSGHASA